jgi:hypothetical protein
METIIGSNKEIKSTNITNQNNIFAAPLINNIYH